MAADRLWSPVPVAIAADFERRFHLTVLETYGLSECPMGTSNLATMRKRGSIGKPARNPDLALYTRVRLVDDVERDVPVGQVGEVFLQSPAPKPRPNGWKNTSCARSMPVACRADIVPVSRGALAPATAGGRTWAMEKAV